MDTLRIILINNLYAFDNESMARGRIICVHSLTAHFYEALYTSRVLSITYFQYTKYAFLERCNCQLCHPLLMIEYFCSYQSFYYVSLYRLQHTMEFRTKKGKKLYLQCIFINP